MLANIFFYRSLHPVRGCLFSASGRENTYLAKIMVSHEMIFYFMSKAKKQKNCLLFIRKLVQHRFYDLKPRFSVLMIWNDDMMIVEMILIVQTHVWGSLSGVYQSIWNSSIPGTYWYCNSICSQIPEDWWWVLLFLQYNQPLGSVCKTRAGKHLCT